MAESNQPVVDELSKVSGKLTEINETQKATLTAVAGNAAENAGPEAPHPEEQKWWGKLLGGQEWMKKEAQRASKLAKLGLGKVTDFGKAAASKVEHFAKNILDLLLKGLGLAALWALFKWASEADWEQILADAKVWWEKAKKMWAQLMVDLENLSYIVEKVKGWVQSFEEKWETISNIIGGAWMILTRFAAWYWMKNLVKNFTTWFGKNALIRTILSDIRKVFGKNSTIGGAVKALKDWTKLKLFNFSSPFRTLLRWIKLDFGKGSLISKALVAVKNFGKLLLFGIASPLQKLLAEIKSIFGKNGPIAKRLSEMKKGATKTLFGPNSIIGKFRSFFQAPIDKKLSAKYHTKVVGQAPITLLWQRIVKFFSPSPFISNILTDIKGTATFQALFGPESSIMKMVDWVKNMFGMGGKGGFSAAIASILENPAIQKLVKGLATIGSKALAILGPIGWIIAAYDAIAGEGGFMDKFEKQEGSWWDKTIAGLGGAIQNLIDFFFLDLMGLAEDSLKWLMKKVLGIFGVDEKEIEKSDWYNFSLAGFLSESIGDAITFIEGVLTFNPKKIWEGLSGFFGKAGDFMSWVYNNLVAKPFNWIAKELFGEDAWQLDDDIDISKWFTENVVDPIWAKFKEIWDIDWGAAILGILPEWAVTAMKKTGIIDDRTPEQIAAEEAEEAADQAKWDKRKKEGGLFGALKGSVTDFFADDDNKKVIPEKLQKDDGMGGYGNHAINVEGAKVNNNSSSTLIPTSSHNPVQGKYLYSNEYG